MLAEVMGVTSWSYPQRIGSIISPPTVVCPLPTAGRRWQELDSLLGHKDGKHILGIRSWPDRPERLTSGLLHGRNLLLMGEINSDCQASPVSPDQAPSHSLDHMPTHRGSSFYSEHGNLRHILYNECFLHIISFNSPNSPMGLVSLLSHFKDEETQA